MTTLQLEPLSDECFQQLSALLDAPQAATLTTYPSFASGINLDCFDLVFSIQYLLLLY